MSSLGEIFALREYDVAQAAAYLGLRPEDRQSWGRYGRLEGLDVLKSETRPGIRFYLQGDEVALVTVGRAALPKDLSDKELEAAASVEPQKRRSRQAKAATLKIAAEDGFAWSSVRGEIGWIELFAPRSFERFLEEIYEEPPKFIQ